MKTAEMIRHENDLECVHMTDEALLAEVRRRMTICAQSLVELANVACPALRRGLDLSFVNPQLLDVLRRIEGGQVIPEMAEQYLHCRVFSRLKNLPLDDQRMILEKGTVEVVVRRGDRFDTRNIRVDALTPDQQRLVFENGRIRSQAEMIAILEDEPEPEADPYDDAITSFKFPSVSVDVTKAEAKRLKEKAERSGGMAEFLKHAIKRMM